MNTTELVQQVTFDRPAPRTTARSAVAPSYHQLAGPLRRAILRGRQLLISGQRCDGSWLGRQTGDASLSSQLVLLLTCLGRKSTDLAQRAAATIEHQQLAEGGWSRQPHDPADISISVQAYLALRIAGREPTDECMARARDVIRSLGGAEAADAATRYLLALFGQVEYDDCPPVFPELLLFGGSRRGRADRPRLGTAMAVLYTLRPIQNCGLIGGIRELFVTKPSDWPAAANGPAANRLAGLALRQCEKFGWTPLRRRALERGETELLCRVDPLRIADLSFVELAWHMIALQALGFTTNSRPLAACNRRFHELVWIDSDEDRAWPQPSSTPLTDTVLSLRALDASGAHLEQINAAAALAWFNNHKRQTAVTLTTVDLAHLVQLGNTAFDGATANGLALPPCLHLTDGDRSGRRCTADRLRNRIKRTGWALDSLVRKLLIAQKADGGWAFCDRGEDASSPEVTGEVLSALSSSQDVDTREAVARAITYLRSTQRADGSWGSLAAGQFIRGTSVAVCGLLAAGIDRNDAAIADGVHWLLVYQQPNGGWNELLEGKESQNIECQSPSATADAVTALVAAGKTNDAAARRAVQFLIESQQEAGVWHEGAHHNELHATAGPLFALSRWAVAAAAKQAIEPERPFLQLYGASAHA